MTRQTIPAAATLAAYAVRLRYDDIPPAVLRQAKNCLIDTVAAALYGVGTAPARIAARYAAHGGAGPSRILGSDTAPVRAEMAAFANGVMAHALELDSLRKPGAGVHPGAVLVPTALAIAQETGASGRDVLAAIVAGCEVLFRIGRATRHSTEARGFHAPGLTGPFGAAIVAGRLLGLDAPILARALGIAGSLSAGLLAFAAAGDGGMVKRLHLGRAAENGIVAARLAADGFDGPAEVLEGHYGFLAAFCSESDPALLTEGLGQTYEMLKICFKRFPCHITAHTPVTAIQALRAAHDFTAAAVERVIVDGTVKMAQMHAGTAPADLVLAQYSIPFCVAVALLRDPADPDSFGQSALDDPAIRDLCRRVTVTAVPGASGWATTTRLHLRRGEVLQHHADDFPGTPAMPLDAAGIGRKFLMLTRRLGPSAAPLLARLEHIEAEPNLHWLTGIALPPGERA